MFIDIQSYHILSFLCHSLNTPTFFVCLTCDWSSVCLGVCLSVCLSFYCSSPSLGISSLVISCMISPFVSAPTHSFSVSFKQYSCVKLINRFLLWFKFLCSCFTVSMISIVIYLSFLPFSPKTCSVYSISASKIMTIFINIWKILLYSASWLNCLWNETFPP